MTLVTLLERLGNKQSVVGLQGCCVSSHCLVMVVVSLDADNLLLTGASWAIIPTSCNFIPSAGPNLFRGGRLTMTSNGRPREAGKCQNLSFDIYQSWLIKTPLNVLLLLNQHENYQVKNVCVKRQIS